MTSFSIVKVKHIKGGECSEHHTSYLPVEAAGA